MSFHYQPQVDSSDEEGVDLSAWQSSTKSKGGRPTQATPVAVTQARSYEEYAAVQEEKGANDEEDIAGFMETANDLTTQTLDDDDGEDGFKEEDTDAVEITGSAPARGRTTATRSPVGFSGFTSINAPTPRRPTPSSDEDDAGLDVGPATRRLIPVVPRNELEDDERAEFEDFTAGGDVVRRVLKEVKDGQRNIRYETEFEDWSVEVVS